MRALSSLIGLQVISASEGTKLGTVADIYVDLSAGELVCVTLAKTPELRVILAEDIDVIGDDALMISDQSKLKSREDTQGQLERGKRVLSNPPSVVTSQGKTLGQLGAVQIDEGSKKVIRFEVTGGPLKDVTEGVLALPILDGIVHGQDTVIVPHDVVARRLVQSGGLRGALRNFGERLKVGVDDIGERSGEFVRESEEKIKKGAQDARKKASQAAEKASEVADKARQRAGEVAEDAKEALERKEPDASCVEDSDAKGEDTAQPGASVGTHLVPGAATPLPEGEEITESATVNPVEDRDSEDEGDKETD